MKTSFQAIRLLLGLTLLTGAIYPLTVWAIGHVFFRQAAEGSLLERHGQVVGSVLLAQKTTDPRYFQPRPSAGDYATVASGASNQAWTNGKLRETVAANTKLFREQNPIPDATSLPGDAATTSGSGLDPHLSIEAVRLQLDRVVTARKLSATQTHALEELVARLTEGGQFSPRHLNVLQLNLALDAAFPPP